MATGWTEPDEGPAGRRQLLAAAIDVIREHGAPALRMTDVAERAGVSFALIAHHFGSREGLVAAAQRTLLRGELSADLDAGRRAVDEAGDAASLLDAVHAMSAALLHPTRRDARIGRIAALAVAHGSPDARAMIVDVVTEKLDEVTEVVRHAQGRGLVRRDLDARAIATFLQAYALGLVLADLDGERVSDEALVTVIAVAVRAILSPADAEDD